MDCDFSEIELATGLLVSTFQKYAARDGNTDKMSKNELKDFIKDQCPRIYNAAVSTSDGFDDMFTTLDCNESGDVCFREYCSIVCGLAYALRGVLKYEEQQRKQ